MLSIKKKSLVIAVLILVIMHIMAFNVLAADMEKLNQEIDRQHEQPTYKTNLWLDFFKLLVILVLIVGATWSVVRFFGRQATGKMQGTWIHVVDEVLLGQNRGIVLCEVGEKVYALGVTDHNITLLCEIDNPKLQEEISQAGYLVRDEMASASDLKQKITGMVKSITPGQPDKSQDTGRFHALMAEQVKRLQDMSQNQEGENRKKDRSGDHD